MKSADLFFAANRDRVALWHVVEGSARLQVPPDFGINLRVDWDAGQGNDTDA